MVAIEIFPLKVLNSVRQGWRHLKLTEHKIATCARAGLKYWNDILVPYVWTLFCAYSEATLSLRCPSSRLLWFTNKYYGSESNLWFPSVIRWQKTCRLELTELRKIWNCLRRISLLVLYGQACPGNGLDTLSKWSTPYQSDLNKFFPVSPHGPRSFLFWLKKDHILAFTFTVVTDFLPCKMTPSTVRHCAQTKSCSFRS